MYAVSGEKHTGSNEVERFATWSRSDVASKAFGFT